MNGRTLLPAMVWAMWGSGCASFASFQELDTLPAQETQVGLGATVTGYSLDLGGEDPQSFVVPAANFWARYGVTDDFELHTRAWLPLGATVGGKYQFLGDRNEPGFGLSAGLDVGYLALGSGDNRAQVVDLYVPVHTGYRVSQGFTTYLTPKYLLRTSLGSGGTSLGHSVGGTFGIAIGKKTTLYAEGSGLYSLTTRSPGWTAGLGVGF